MIINRKTGVIQMTKEEFYELVRRIVEKIVMMIMTPYVCIVNAKGTSGDEPDNTKTWKEYWEKETGVSLDKILPSKNGKYLCPTHMYHEKGNDGYVEESRICGCHVQVVNSKGKPYSNRLFITPMCSGCNQRKGIFRLPAKSLVRIK